MGKTSHGDRRGAIDGKAGAAVNVLLVTVHDSRTRLVGHYCLMDDRTREELELEEQVEESWSRRSKRAPRRAK